MSNNKNERIRVDLHLHTTASDGTWHPERLVEELVKSDIRIFSVTDHDTVESIKRVAALAEEAKLHFIPGVEMNCSFEGFNYHILGYGIDCNSSGLQKIMKDNILLLEDKDRECVSYLQGRGLSVCSEEFETYEEDKTKGGWKALNYLQDKGLCSGHKDFFNLFEEDGNPFETLKYPHPMIVIDLIKDAGGVCVLAHPGARFYNKDVGYVINKMLEFGIDGIECYHPENNNRVEQLCVDFCKAKDLIITGGSDCHGDFISHRSLCSPEVYLDMLNLKQLI